MKKIKNLIGILLVLVLSIGLLSGCKNDTPSNNQQGTQEDSNDSGDSNESTGESSESGEKMTISVMGIDWGYGPVENSEMEQWWEDYFDVEFDIEWVSYTDYDQKLNTLLSSGKQDDIPDVVQIKKVDSSFYYPVFAQAIDAGGFLDLTEYLFDGGIVENNEIMSTWSDTIWENATYNGGIYILPRSTSEVAPQSGVSVRRDLMREHGFEEEPKNMDELKDWLIGLAKASGLYALDFSTPDFDHDRVKAFAVAFTGVMDWGIDENGEFVHQPFADGYIDFLNWMKDLYDEGVLDPEFILDQGTTSDWKAGNSVAFLNAWYNWNQSEDRVTSKIFDKNLPDTYEAWGLMPLEGPKGYAVNVDPYGFGEAITINSNVSEEKLAKILEVFNQTSEEYRDVLQYGVEDLHYNFDENGVRQSTDEQAAKKQEGYVGAWNQIFLKANADMINDKFVARESSAEAIERAKEIKQATENMVQEMDLKMENLNLNSETYASRWSSLVADLDDMRGKYVMGQISEDDWFAYVDSIVNSADYQDIIAEFKAAAEQ